MADDYRVNRIQSEYRHKPIRILQKSMGNFASNQRITHESLIGDKEFYLAKSINFVYLKKFRNSTFYFRDNLSSFSDSVDYRIKFMHKEMTVECEITYHE